MNRKHGRCRGIPLFVALSCVLATACAVAETIPSVQLRVIDSSSGNPLEKANVIFFAEATDGTFTGHGGSSSNLFLVEGVTDHAGVVRFPAQTFDVPFWRNLHGPFMYVYKPGYHFGYGSGGYSYTRLDKIIAIK